MNPKYGSIAYRLHVAHAYCTCAVALREQQKKLRYTPIMFGDFTRTIDREIKRRVRANALAAIAHTLQALVLLRTGTGNLA